MNKDSKRRNSEDVAGRDERSMKEYDASKKRRTLLRLISYFKYHPWLTASALLLALAMNIAAIWKPLVLEIIVDDYVALGNYDMNAITFLVITYFILILVSSVGSYLNSITLTLLGQKIMHRLRCGLFDHIQKMNMGFFDHNSSGSILVRVSSDVESLSDLYSSILVSVVREVVMIIGVLIAMFSLSPGLAAASLVLVPLIAVLTFVYRRIARKNFIQVKAQLSRINSFLSENIIGMKVVQLFGREKQKYDDFHGLGKEYYRLGLKEIILNSLSMPLLTMISNLAVSVIIVSVVPDVAGGVLEVGVLYAFITYIKQLFDPIAAIAEQFTSMQSAIISADRIFDIIDNTAQCEDIDSGISADNLKGDIEFRDVCFSYNEGTPVLKNVSFKVKAGQRAAFVGATGSGKSTIISLIARFYEIDSGQILLDGIDVREYNLTSLRRAVSVVMQDVFLFTGDLRYNIRLNEGISDADVTAAAKTVGAHGFITALPDSYESAVAERGGTFSAGQRQLVAFARALAADPTILVLDEATANIDTESEASIQSALIELTHRKTLLVIAHRMATVSGSDVIFVMSDGQIIERGNHAELMEMGGHYARLYELSIKNSENEA